MIKINNLNFLTCFLAFFVLSACANRNLDEIMSRAEEAMNDYPEQALEKLDSINRESLVTRKQKARYALLYSMALDKNYIDIASDSIIAPAVRYYANHGTADNKVKTLYYYARIQYNSADYNAAILSLTRTLHLSGQVDDIRMLALIHNLFAVTYNVSYMFDDSMKHIDKAYQYALECGDMKLADIILFRKAQIYVNIREYSEAEHLFVQIIENNLVSSETLSMVLCDYALSVILRENCDFNLAVQLYERALDFAPSFYDFNHWGAYSYALNQTGNINKANTLFAQLNGHDDTTNSVYNAWKYRVCRDNGDYESAYYMIAEVLHYQDSVFREQFQNTAAQAQRDFWILKTHEMDKDRHQLLIISSLIIILLVLTIILTYIVYKRRMGHLIRERESLFGLAESVQTQLNMAEEQINSLRVNIDEKENVLKVLRHNHILMYKSQFKTLGSLCETVIRADSFKNSHKIVYDKVKEMLSEINGDNSGHLLFEKRINDSLNNIMIHFRGDFPNYGESDYRFVSYIIVGFDATIVSMILGMPSQDAVYMKKSRIKKQIQKSDSEYKSQYLDMF